MQTLRSSILAPVRQLADTVRHYRLRQARGDLIAGLTVAVVEIPQAMAYAYIAGVPPEYGIYTSIVQGLVGAMFASNDHLATGATNTQSLLVAAVVTRLSPGGGPMFLQLAIGLCLLKGLIQMAFAAARMGSLVRYVSQSVIVGFTAGAGILIAMGQLPAFLGINGIEAGEAAAQLPGVLGRLEQMAGRLDQVHVLSIMVGLGSLGLILTARAISRLVPGPLIAVVVPAAVVYLMGWDEGQLSLVGRLPQSLPGFALPEIDWQQAEALLSGAFALALLGMIETVSIGKSIGARTGERINPNQEFFAQGLANLVGSFFQNIPGSGSFTRSALNHMASGQTRFAGIYSALLVAIIFLLLGPLARYIPLASLAAILFVVAWGLIDWRQIRRIVRVSRSDATVCLITLLSAVLMPLAYAIYVGIFLNIGLYLHRAGQLHLAEMVRSPGGPFMERPVRDRAGDKKVIFLQIEGDLFFGVAEELQDRLLRIANSGVRVVILRMKRTHSIDMTCLVRLEEFVSEMHAKGSDVLLCGLREDLLQQLQHFGLVDQIGQENVFAAQYGVFTSAKAALQRARILAGGSIDVDKELGDEDLTERWTYDI